MNTFFNTTWRIENYLSSIRITDVIDILVVAYLIYQLIMLVRKTNIKNVAKGLILLLAIVMIANLLHLTMVSYILKKGMELGLIALVILFQPELRRLLEKLGSRISNFRKPENVPIIDNAIEQTVIACDEMSKSKTGALIIFERSIKLNEIIETGTILDAEVNSELLKNIFYNKAPLHDGAVVIREGRIAAAGCILPLTKNQNLSKDLGMRHRAGIGLSEESDAIVVIVSEETGAISCAKQGMLKRHLNADTLDALLRAELIPDDSVNKDTGIISNLKRVLFAEDKEKSDEKVD